MERYNVELLPSAYSDFDDIFDYIMADNPQAAGTILDKMMQSLRHLEHFPHSGASLLERSLKKFEFRMVIIDKKVIVYRILHGARYYTNLLKDTMK